MKLRCSFIAAFTYILLISCTPPADMIPRSTIQILLTGSTTNNITMSWTVHGHRGSQTIALNNNSSNPWHVMYDDIVAADFGNVFISVQNTLGNQVLLTGDSAAVFNWAGSEKTLDLSDLGVPSDLSSISTGDILEDNSGQLLHIISVQNTTPPHQLTVKDSDNKFDTGTWRILSSNSAYFTVWIKRDGITVGTPKTYGTLIGNVDFSYGSIAW